MLQYEQWNLFSNKFGISIYSLLLLLPDDENPSCLQTTWASIELHRSSHTVPHTPLTQTSTRPSRDEEPPTSLTEPLVQAEKITQ